MSVLGARAFIAPRLWYAVRYHKRVPITAANMRRLMDAWRGCVSDRPLFGDKGEMYYERFGGACEAVFPGCRFVLTVRDPLDTLSSYARQGWAAWMRHGEEPDAFNLALRERARVMLAANARWRERAAVLSFADMADRGAYEAALRAAFAHLGADPDAYDYDAGWVSCAHAGSVGRWREDEQIVAFAEWLGERDPELHAALVSAGGGSRPAGSARSRP
jgi:hypothetical protein